MVSEIKSQRIDGFQTSIDFINVTESTQPTPEFISGWCTLSLCNVVADEDM